MIRRMAFLRVVNLTFFYSSIKVVFFVIIWWYGSTESSTKVFVALALFNNIRNLITSYLPNGILQLAEARVAMRRIEKYLNSAANESHYQYSIQHCPTYGQQIRDSESDPFIRLSNVSLWSGGQNLNLEIHNGERINIVGGVGTGKTSILKAILNETQLPSGRITYKGRLGYCPQTPWIYPAPMRDNIILNHEYNQEKYDRILRACALSNLGHISMESLSGGMRARISLARAAYSEADIYLFDDPLAALDKNTKTHILKELINKVLCGKIVIICGGDGGLGKTISLDSVTMARRKSVPDSFEDPQPKQEEEERTEAVDEFGKSGGVSWKTLYKYFKSGCGPYGFFVLILANVLCQASFTGTDYYLRVW